MRAKRAKTVKLAVKLANRANITNEPKHPPAVYIVQKNKER